MAGERVSKITIRASWSADPAIRGQQTAQVRFYLGGQWYSYQRGGNAGEFVVPDYLDDDGTGNAYGALYVKKGVENLLALVQATLTQQALPYTLSAVRDLGGWTPVGTGGSFTGQPVAEFDITGSYSLNFYDLNFQVVNPPTPSGWLVQQNLTAIQAVTATATPTNAGIFGSSTGSMTVAAYGGSTGIYAYAWSDGATGATRTQLLKGTYQCTVSDQSGASTVATATVDSDPELLVAVTTTDTSITLTPSGGVAPYAYAWGDGATTAARSGLAAGTYACTVTDAHGATKAVSVTLSAYQFYWSRNAIALALDAGAAYRANPSTKPNLSFQCQVWLELSYLSGTFVQVGPTLEQPADAEGRTSFEVQALLDAYLDYHVPAPDLATAQRADPLFKRFFLRHNECYGAPVPTAKTSLSLERNYVARGGLSFYESQARTWFTSYQATVQPFLTWEPASKAVLADQPEYLYYLNLAPQDGLTLHVRVALADDTTQDVVTSVATAVRAYEIYCLPVGYAALGLGALAATAAVRSWQVWLSQADGTRLSETRTFQLAARRYPQRRYLLFATSLGGMATYAALGEAQCEAEVTGSETALALPVGYDPQQGDVAVQARALRPVLKLAAGVRTPAQLLAAQDLLLSPRVLLLGGAADSRWLPGFVKAKTSTVLDEGKRVPTQDLEFVLPSERLYTPDLT